MRRITSRWILPAAIAAVLVAGCGTSGEYDRPATGSESATTSKGPMAGEATLHAAAREAGSERSVMRQATLDVDVENIETAEKEMRKSMAAKGGYIDHEE